MIIGDRQTRDVKIEALFKQGLSPAKIGDAVGLQANRVRTVLKERGHVLSTNRKREEDPYQSIWARNADARRFAIWSRAKRAAREALQANASDSPTINSIHTDQNEAGVDERSDA